MKRSEQENGETTGKHSPIPKEEKEKREKREEKPSNEATKQYPKDNQCDAKRLE